MILKFRFHFADTILVIVKFQFYFNFQSISNLNFRLLKVICHKLQQRFVNICFVMKTGVYSDHSRTFTSNVQKERVDDELAKARQS